MAGLFNYDQWITQTPEEYYGWDDDEELDNLEEDDYSERPTKSGSPQPLEKGKKAKKPQP